MELTEPVARASAAVGAALARLGGEIDIMFLNITAPCAKYGAQRTL
jgi:hypothetical protein